MAIKVKNYNSEQAVIWDDFIWKSVNGTIFHTRKFLNYHPPKRFKDNSLLFLKKNKIFSLFPAVDIEYDRKRTLFSHRGASYGGFVYKEGVSIADSFELVEKLIKYGEKEKYERIVITLPPIIYEHRLSNYIDFALIKKGFTYLKREVSSVVRLEDDINKNVKKFKQTNRTAFRRALKLGVGVRKSEDYEQFYQILKKNLKIRHNVNPTHTLDELMLLKQLFPNRISLYAAYKETDMIAGVIMFDCNKDVSLAFYISHDETKQKYRGVNLLFYHIIDHCIKEGFKYLDFGIFTVNMEPNFGLGRFKEGFGSSGILRDTFILDL